MACSSASLIIPEYAARSDTDSLLQRGNHIATVVKTGQFLAPWGSLGRVHQPPLEHLMEPPSLTGGESPLPCKPCQNLGFYLSLCVRLGEPVDPLYDGSDSFQMIRDELLHTFHRDPMCRCLTIV